MQFSLLLAVLLFKFTTGFQNSVCC